MVRIYGIKNCDSMKKAFKWLDERDITYEFHDYKKAGVPRERLVVWCKTLGWKEALGYQHQGSHLEKINPRTAGHHDAEQGRCDHDGTFQRDPPPGG